MRKGSSGSSDSSFIRARRRPHLYILPPCRRSFSPFLHPLYVVSLFHSATQRASWTTATKKKKKEERQQTPPHFPTSNPINQPPLYTSVLSVDGRGSIATAPATIAAPFPLLAPHPSLIQSLEGFLQTAWHPSAQPTCFCPTGTGPKPGAIPLSAAFSSEPLMTHCWWCVGVIRFRILAGPPQTCPHHSDGAVGPAEQRGPGRRLQSQLRTRPELRTEPELRGVSRKVLPPPPLAVIQYPL